MATYNFTGANGDPLPSGLTAQNGTFEIQSNALVPTGATPAGSGLWIATQPSTADATVSVDFVAGGTSPVLMLRYLDADNFIYCVITSSGEVRLATRIAGSVALIGTATTIPAYSTATSYTASAELAGTSIVLKIDGVTRNSATESFNQTAAIHGISANSTASFDDLTVPDAAATGVITVTTQDYRIWQRDGVGNASVTIDGTYTGTPTIIQRSVDGGAYVTADGTPTGGAFADTFTLATGQYSITYRFSNDVGVTDTVTFISVGDVFACYGQSNMVGIGTASQTYTPSAGGVRACLFGNDDNYKQLIDPYDSDVSQVDAISEDSSAAGSWILRFANEWLANSEVPVGFIPAANSGKTVARLSKTDSTRIGGLNLYESLDRRISVVGGVKAVLYEQGEADSNDINGTTATDYESSLNTLINDINTDFGVKTFIIPLHTITAAGYNGNGTTTGQAPIRQAQLNTASSTNCKIFQSYIGSELTTAITGMTDGTYQTIITSGLDTLLNNTLTYVSGAATTPSLSVAASTSVIGFAIDNEATHVDGAVITGTTV